MEDFIDFQGKYDDAESLHKQALIIRRKVFGEEHPDAAESLNNLAEVYRAQVRFSVHFFSITAPRYGAFLPFLGQV